MALPLPTAPIAIPPASELVDRGPVQFHPATKSTISRPSVYRQNNVCDVEAYEVGSIAITINQNSEDCQNVLAANVSLSVRVPVGATAADVNALVDEATRRLILAMAFEN